MKRHVAMLAAVCFASIGARAATITTQDGSVITGDILSLKDGVYTIKTPYGTQTVPGSSIRFIQTDSAAPDPSRDGSRDASKGGAAGSNGPLRLAGSTTIGDDLAPALLEAYAGTRNAGDITWTQEGSSAEQLLEAKGNNVVFNAHLSRHGSGTAFTGLAEGKADIGMASRRIEPAEQAKLSGAGLGDASQPGQENVLALDGIIMIVNRANPVAALTTAQLKDIFAGKTTNWSEVGGADGPIHLVGRDAKSGTADSFKALVMGGAPVSPSLAVVDGAEGVALKVQGDAGAIGYTGFAYLGDNKAISVGTECGLEFPAADLYVRTEEYPLSRRLFLYTPQTTTNAETAPFLNFALGPAGQDIARKKNFIDLVPQVAPTAFGRNAVALDLVQLSDDHGATRDDVVALVNYARHANNGNRISTTFRFQSGSANLDARAVRDIDRLVDFLRSPAAANRRLLVAGFADTVGSSQAGRRLSQERATQIAGLLHNKGVDAKEVVGYGRVAPVACNSTPAGREKNRRVEVWLF